MITKDKVTEIFCIIDECEKHLCTHRQRKQQPQPNIEYPIRPRAIFH